MNVVEETGYKTCYAAEELQPNRRVKLDGNLYTNTPGVVYADAGEQALGVTPPFLTLLGDAVAIKLMTTNGTFAGVAADSFALNATLYAANDGKISDTSSGTAIGKALEEATASGDVVEWAPFPVISTTAATVSIADAGSLITATTVEAALQEIMQAIKTVQYDIRPSSIMLEDGTALTAFADGASTVPGYTQIGNKGAGIRWNDHATPGDIQMIFHIPQDFDDTADAVVHVLGTIIKAGGAIVDSPLVAIEAYFSGVGDILSSDTDCGGDTTEFTLGTLEEGTLTITAANIPASPQQLTLIVHPKDGQLGTDDFIMADIWLEGKRKALTS